jgi:hypothetical protein
MDPSAAAGHRSGPANRTRRRSRSRWSWPRPRRLPVVAGAA